MSQVPSVGRIVHYFADRRPGKGEEAALLMHAVPGQPLAALVVAVHPGGLVNLTVFDQDGGTWARLRVPLVPDGEPHPPRSYCVWPPRIRS